MIQYYVIVYEITYEIQLSSVHKMFLIYFGFFPSLIQWDMEVKNENINVFLIIPFSTCDIIHYTKFAIDDEINELFCCSFLLQMFLLFGTTFFFVVCLLLMFGIEDDDINK